MSQPAFAPRIKDDWIGKQSFTIQSGLHDWDFQVAVEDGGRLPERSYAGDAGYDLFTSETTRVPVGQFRDIPCGIRLRLPKGFWALVKGRSSTLRKRGLLVNDAVIDNGYVGPMYVGVWNLGPHPVEVKPGERIAQLILTPVVVADRLVEVEASELVSRDGRGDGGFGSTGV